MTDRSSNKWFRYLMAALVTVVIWVLAVALTLVWWGTFVGLIVDATRVLLDDEYPILLRLAAEVTEKVWRRVAEVKIVFIDEGINEDNWYPEEEDEGDGES